MHILRITIVILISFSCSYQGHSQIFKWKKKKEKTEKAKSKKSKIKPYDEVITKDAKTQKGLFSVHKVGEEYFFEIPDSLLEEEILVVSRISGFVKGLNFGGAGVKSRPQQVIRWQKKDNKLLLRSVSYNSVASHEDPIYRSVKNNNFEPIIKVFDIKAMAKDSSSYVIDIKSLFTTDIPMIGAVSKFQKQRFGIQGIDSGRSFIEEMKAFPKNVNIKHVLTYRGTKLPDNQITGTMSVEMTQSFIKLPEKPMQPRYFDARVSYFSMVQTDYSDDAQKAKRKRYITRWRLEPKDTQAYKEGKLVEPIKPIVYYLDPATPVKWRKYLKQGIEDWNIAFEAAGFKNAIIAKDPPTKEEDPDWSPEDVRYSVLRYVSTDIQNAMGPHVHDPRTGEILESDIIWYHNVMNLLRNWYFVQTAAINPKARRTKFSDELMGRLIRFVAAHEVGHTLGLPHNMGASAAYPVDSLRSPSFTKRMGLSPTIMDYARFNYVAQPGDGDVALEYGLGPYDKWAIDFGYRWYPDMDQDQERSIINRRIKEKADDPIYRYGRQRRPVDPTSQTEDLGDNSMKAGELGIKNLQRIIPNLVEWTREEGEDYSELAELYNSVMGQYGRYIGHVVTNVGGVYEHFRSSDEEKPVYTHVEKQRQQSAIDFLIKYVFDTPEWLINDEILDKIQESGVVERIRSRQDQTLARLFNPERLERIIDNEALNGQNAYTLSKMFDDLLDGIFRELRSNQPTTIYRRNLHRTFVEVLERTLLHETNKYEHTDMIALARAKLKQLRKILQNARAVNDIDAIHYDDLRERIKLILEPQK